MNDDQIIIELSSQMLLDTSEREIVDHIGGGGGGGGVRVGEKDYLKIALQ